MTRLYFIAAPGEIKIGIAGQVQKRLTELSKKRGIALTLLGDIAGSYKLERAVHGVLDVHRLHGEWFRDCSEVRDLIRDLIEIGPSVVGLDTVEPREKDLAKLDFRQLCCTLWPKNAAEVLARVTGKSFRNCERYVAGHVEPNATLIRALLRSEYGAEVLLEIMRGYDGEWWLERRPFILIAALSALERRSRGNCRRSGLNLQG